MNVRHQQTQSRKKFERKIKENHIVANETLSWERFNIQSRRERGGLIRRWCICRKPLKLGVMRGSSDVYTETVGRLSGGDSTVGVIRASCSSFRLTLATIPAPRVRDSSAEKRSKSKKWISMPKSEGCRDIPFDGSLVDSVCSSFSTGGGAMEPASDSESDGANSAAVVISGDDVGGVEGGGDDFMEELEE